MALETPSKLSIVFVRLTLEKMEVDGVTGPQWKIDIRYEFNFKVVLKGLGCKQRFSQPFFIDFPINN